MKGVFCSVPVAQAAQLPCAGGAAGNVPGAEERGVRPTLTAPAMRSSPVGWGRRGGGRSRLGAALSEEDRGEPPFGRLEAPRCSCGGTAAAEATCPRWAGPAGGERAFQHERAQREAGTPRREGAEAGGGLPTATSAAALGLPRGRERGGSTAGSGEESPDRIKTEK